ncbi:hypothetical protein N7462_007203 [Penicillium macrosclerotiorum]|uniref:uncharacterized protein n=1 Tax=Penicillium macrosclerotiorum TaxID=303699 RepID=UPI0025467F72|nr:uncharacterized protein N7462_007203 [Penicillium macrosclerotiorum]KAJ5678959.1 hypothetical protein N7462_007203 [Penicillium macrosclerotiorum]
MSSAQLPAVHEMWRVAVPQMAFEYEPLLHTLLALGAAHRATLLPNEAHSLRPIYHGYIDSALRYHRPMTANLDGNVSEAVCLNAVLFSLYTLFLRSETSEGPYEPPIMWISMARGIRTVMKNVYHQLVATESRLCPLLLAQPMLWNQGSTMQYTGPLKPFQHLLEHQIEEELSDKIRNAYAGAVQYLERLYIAVQTREPDFIIRKMFNGFPPVVPRLFLDLVSEKQPRALVILAHFFALAKSAENIWWLRGVPEREVCGINSIIPAEWKWALIWPLDVVSQPSTSKDPTEPSIPLSIRNVLDTLF